MTMYLSMFAILSILSYIEFIGNISYKQKKRVILIILIIYVLYSAFYMGADGDRIVYEEYFYATNTGKIPLLANTYFEYLYSLLNYFVKLFINSYIVFRFVLAVIVMSIWYKIYTNSFFTLGNKYNFTVMLVVWALMFGCTHIARSTIAITLCLFSIKYIRTKKIFKFLFCTVVALGFHSMTVVWFPMYFIYNKVKLKNFLFLLVIAVVIGFNYINGIILFISKLFTFIPIVGNHIYNRINLYIMESAGNTFGVKYSYLTILLKGLANVVMIIIVSQYLYRSVNRDSKVVNRINSYGINSQMVFACLYNQYLIGAILYVIALSTSIALSRVALFFTSAQFFIAPYVLEINKTKSKIYKLCIYMIFLFYCFIRMLVAV